MTDGTLGPSGSGDLIADGVEHAVQRRLARVDRLLRQCENSVADLEARLPALRRDLVAVREDLNPTKKEETDGS
jgi:hypothetical protein